MALPNENGTRVRAVLEMKFLRIFGYWATKFRLVPQTFAAARARM
jgi:hypothetical protein